MRVLLGRIVAIIGVMFLVSACATPARPEYFRLEAHAPGASFQQGPVIGLRPIAVPEYIQRRALVWKTASHQLEVSATQRWAEPLPDNILQVVSLNIANLVPTNTIRRQPWLSSERPEVIVTIAILDLIADSESATLVAEVSLSNGDGIVSSQMYRWERPIIGELGGSSIATAFSELLLALSEVAVDRINGYLAED